MAKKTSKSEIFGLALILTLGMWGMAIGVGAFLFTGDASSRPMESGAYTETEKKAWRASPVDTIMVFLKTSARKLAGSSMKGTPIGVIVRNTSPALLLFIPLYLEITSSQPGKKKTPGKKKKNTP